MNREEWLKSLKSDKGTVGFEEENGIETPRVLMMRKLRSDMAKGPIQTIRGAFGPEKDVYDAFVEEKTVSEDGVFIKFYGCSIPHKGYPDANRVHNIELAKWILSDFLRDHWFIIGLKALRWKKFINDADKVAFAIDWKTTRHLDIPQNEYRKAVREIRRACKVALKTLGVDLDDIPQPSEVRGKKVQFACMLARLIKFLLLFIESDTAYCYRIQDALGERKGLIPVIKLLQSRETHEGIGYKWKFILLGSRVALLNKQVRQFFEVFFKEINQDIVKLDDDDFYYSLKFLSYNFRGMSTEDRWELRDKIDFEKGHCHQFSYDFESLTT